RPSPPPPRGGSSAASRTAAPASARLRAPSRRREASRSAARRHCRPHPASWTHSTVRLHSEAVRGIISAGVYVPYRRLDRSDNGGAVGSGVGSLRAALDGRGSVLVVTADLRGGLPTSTDEAAGGDGAAALLVGDDDEDAPVIAELIGAASATEEFIDRWRTPGDVNVKQWEERFGETKYLPLGEQAWNSALKVAELTPEQVDRVIVSGTHAR